MKGTITYFTEAVSKVDIPRMIVNTKGFNTTDHLLFYSIVAVELLQPILIFTVGRKKDIIQNSRFYTNMKLFEYYCNSGMKLGCIFFKNCASVLHLIPHDIFRKSLGAGRLPSD